MASGKVLIGGGFVSDAPMASATRISEKEGGRALEATNAFGQSVQELEAIARPAAASQGESSAEYLGSGSLRQASADFRKADLWAQLRVTNVGDGFLVTEDYRT